MAEDWDIKPRADACGACTAGFADRQPYFSCLVFGAQGYARQDFCAACWQARTPAPNERFSAWKGVFRMPPPPAEEPLKKETAESLLRKLIEAQDPARQSAIFILAVMLERKRVLVERDVQVQEGQTTRVYEHRQSGETFVIQDPHLNLNELGDVQREVAELLGGGQPAAAGPAGPAAVRPDDIGIDEADAVEDETFEADDDAEVADEEVDVEEDEEQDGDEDEFDDDEDDEEEEDGDEDEGDK